MAATLEQYADALQLDLSLMYKTEVYRLVNGGISRITHQKQQISEKGDTTQQYIA